MPAALNLFAKLLEWLTKNWEIFINAPIPFFSLLGVGGFIGWFCMSNQLKNSQKRIEELERRLGEAEPDSVYRSFTNKELKRKVETFDKKLKKLFDKLEAQEPENGTITYDFSDEINTENGQPLIRELEIYWEEYKPEVIKLRDELFKRLPSNICKPTCTYRALCSERYANPVNRNSIIDVADDLKRLASQLKI